MRLGEKTTGGTKLPLQPRNPNVMNTASFASSVSSVSGCSKTSSAANTRKLSILESSNNENNKRISSFRRSGSSSSSVSAYKNDTNENDSSTFTHTGQRLPGSMTNGGGRNVGRAVSVGRAGSVGRAASVGRAGSVGRASSKGRDAPDQKPPKSSVDTDRENRSQKQQQPAPGHPPSVPSKRSDAAAPPRSEQGDNDTILIEEMRRNPNGDGYTVHHYLRGRILGKGGFAKVYECTAQDTKKMYAVKIVPKANLVKTRARQKLQAEIKIHRTLKHKHICEYKHFFEDRSNCYILLELCHNQSMNELIKRRKRLTEPEVMYYMKQIIQAVRYMHENNVIHRDLKLGNLFLDKNLRIKVGDLGLATKLESAEEKRKTICGTPNYIAPEVIDGNKETRGHSFEVDIWSMGVIFYTTLIGKPPYESKDVKATYQRILANEYDFPSHIPISQHARNLITSLLQTKPEMRPTIDEISAHPFFTCFGSKVPRSLPQSATRIAPDWQEDEFGNLVAAEHLKEEEHKYWSSSSRRKKNHGSLPQASESHRHPLGARDPNAMNNGGKESEKNQSSKRQESSDAYAEKEKRKLQSRGTPSQQGFHIYDDNETNQHQHSSRPKSQHAKPPQSRPNDDIHNLAAQTAACSLGTDSRTTTSPRPSNDVQQRENVPPATSAERHSQPKHGCTADQDMHVLENMHRRLNDGLSEAETNRHTPGATLRPVASGGASIWITRYVDYTSKYGLGFLLNDGSAGVYFNDSTKAVLAPEGETFQYVERRKVPSEAGAHSRSEPLCETYTLSSFPESLQKKVTLLKHFRNYLIEQQKRADDNKDNDTTVPNNSSGCPEDELTDAMSMVYLKKWVRTKHAILFRLSDRTVQVVFYDHTEVLLSSDAQLVTYVDKSRKRTTYHLDDVMSGNAEISKRLKYAKDILQQLISGSKS